MPPLAAVPDLDHELDELYGLPLEQWTRARNDLASRLKKAHQAEQAETVQKLRKPSAVAWAINQLARREKSSVESLLQAGERLRKAQEEALRGESGATDVSAAARNERDLVRELVASAREILEEAGNAATQPTLDRISQTLRAAAVDDAGRELLSRGRLDEELEGIGFGTLTAVTPAARRPPRPRPDELKQARERLATLRAEARRLAKEARTAEADAARAEREAERARQEAAARRQEADRADTDVAEAEADLARRKA